MHKYECECGYEKEHYLRIMHPCPDCDRELKEKTLIQKIKRDKLSTKFIPIYSNDKLWYYRRQPKNLKKKL